MPFFLFFVRMLYCMAFANSYTNLASDNNHREGSRTVVACGCAATLGACVANCPCLLFFACEILLHERVLPSKSYSTYLRVRDRVYSRSIEGKGC